MEGRELVSVIPQRSVPSSDLQQERPVFVRVSQHFCNWLLLAGIFIFGIFHICASVNI